MNRSGLWFFFLGIAAVLLAAADLFSGILFWCVAAAVLIVTARSGGVMTPGQTTIKDVDALRRAAMNEFLATHPDICVQWQVSFGHKVWKVLRGELDEEKFTAEWRDWTPPDSQPT